MKLITYPAASLLAMALTFSPARAENQKSTVDQQRQQAEEQARPGVGQQAKEAQQRAEQSVDKEAVAAIEETNKAIQAIAQNNATEGLAAIERATGKINILLARKPATGLIPVAVAVTVIDLAPESLDAIKRFTKAVDAAVDLKAFPTARVVLESLASEIRVRTTNLPLASYPAALKEAARLLEAKKNQEASGVLLTALNTLALIDVTTPLPLMLAHAAIAEAESLRDKDKGRAEQLLGVARHQLERARALGYTGKDPEYEALDKEIKDLEKQIKGGGDTGSVFTKLKEKFSAFFKRLSTDKQPEAQGKQ